MNCSILNAAYLDNVTRSTLHIKYKWSNVKRFSSAGKYFISMGYAKLRNSDAFFISDWILSSHNKVMICWSYNQSMDNISHDKFGFLCRDWLWKLPLTNLVEKTLELCKSYLDKFGGMTVDNSSYATTCYHAFAISVFLGIILIACGHCIFGVTQ